MALEKLLFFLVIIMCRSSGCNLLSEFESKNSNKNVENAFSVTNKF